MTIKCDQIVVQGEILAHSSISSVNIDYTVLIKVEKLTTHMHFWLKYGLHNFD